MLVVPVGPHDRSMGLSVKSTGGRNDTNTSPMQVLYPESVPGLRKLWTYTGFAHKVSLFGDIVCNRDFCT